MFRGRKRKLPFCFVPSPPFRGSESEDEVQQPQPGQQQHHAVGTIQGHPRHHLQNQDLQQHPQLDNEGGGDEQRLLVQLDHDRVGAAHELEVPGDDEAQVDNPGDDEAQVDNPGDDDLQLRIIEDMEDEIIQIPNFNRDGPNQAGDDGDGPNQARDDGVDAQQQDYFHLLDSLSKAWILMELEHTVSNTASEAF